MKMLRTKSVIAGIFIFLLPFGYNPEIERSRIMERKMKRIILFLGFVLIGLLIVLLTSAPLQAAIPASERAALIALYNAADGDYWLDNSGWKGNNNEPDGFSQIGSEDTWYGITVSGDHVTTIDLCSNDLKGSIPPELGNLKNLIYLLVTKNQLSGSIPTELGNLSCLEYLALSINRLSGNIPPELGKLSNLYALCLNSNQLSGNIPSELGDLRKLVFLLLDSNRLTGNIPSSLTNLTNLYPDEEFTNIGCNALYTDDDNLRTFLNSKDNYWEHTQTIAPSDVVAAAISSSLVVVCWTPILYTNDSGGYKVYYSTTSGGPYTYSGMTIDKLTGVYKVTGLAPGTTYYLVVKTQTDPHYGNDNTVVSEYSEEVSATTNIPHPDMAPPFGSFDTPIDGSTVFGSIPVTGWALDDSGVENVKIYRENGSQLVYIGDATFVEGARPDVAEAYPEYLNNTRAGWGYMMLTNFLPNRGNGTFVIHAITTDLVGKTTTLGTRTIKCDNANAVKPFGAIDTPTQGGTASGSSFVNWGWVLTPPPNSIPTDGSTINVFVDGVNIGHPTYNIYRADIANLFPGYANSNGAIGYFYLDTTSYANGVHTIQWIAADDAGNKDGIGSRYFTIHNTAERLAQHAWRPDSREQACLFQDSIRDIPLDYSSPILVKKGFVEDVEPEEISPDNEGLIKIEINELERLVIQFSESNFDMDLESYSSDCLTRKSTPSYRYSGYLQVGSSLKSLPVGSTLDSERGVFYWQPGPGFIGEYRFVFIEKGQDMDIKRSNIIVKIVPRFEK